MTAKPFPAEAATPAPRTPKPQAYVTGSHTARVLAEHDERRVELLALHDVLSAQREAIDGQLEDIGGALALLSNPATQQANIVRLQAAE